MSDHSDLSPQPSTSIPGRPVENRRSFFAITAAVVTGSIAVLTPIGVGIAAFLTPLFRKSKSPEVRIALLDQVPDDGMPRYFPVVADREDAWTRYPAQRVGAVYLIRNAGEEKPTAFTAKCPHAGCFIGYTPGAKVFQCPCHTSAFKLNGERLNGDAEVAPRGMDTLPVSIRQAKTGDGTEIAEVWVEFIDFQTGHKEKIPTA
jgi:menaquinol-cytochrome c reductase iron-sulfur subunit